jgi:hypothetical protein
MESVPFCSVGRIVGLVGRKFWKVLILVLLGKDKVEDQG